MIDFLATSTISLTAFLVFYHLVLEREKIHQFNRFYLLFSIVVSLLIPFLSFEIIKEIEVESTQNLFPIELHQNQIVFKEKIDYTYYILWVIYSLFSMFFLVKFVRNLLHFKEIISLNENVKYKNAILVLLEQISTPHTFLHFIFLNKEAYFQNKIEDELYEHEITHVNQKHTYDIILIEILKVIFWFNPIFYFYKKAIQLNHEFIADEKVVNTYQNVTFYQSLLLNTNANKTYYLASNLNYLVTKKRLIMMTKTTSKKLAILKKIAIVPLLAGLLYFFCIEIVAQEKNNTVNSKSKTSTISEKDKLRDSYYSGVYIKIIDEKSNRNEVSLYENLSLEDKRKYLDFVPEKITENEVPQSLFEKMKTQNMAVWINNINKTKEEIKKYKREDFSYYTSSFVHKNARSKRFPQEYQYTLYTKDFFNKNMKNSHLHYSGDTIAIVKTSWKTVKKHRTQSEDINLSTPTRKKDEINLFINDTVKKKNKIPRPKPTYCPEVDPKNESIKLKKIEDKAEVEKLNSQVVSKLSDYDPKDKKQGYIYMKNGEFIGTYFFIKNDEGKIEYYNRYGNLVNENGEKIEK